MPEMHVRLRWPDGETTTAVAGPVTGLGRAGASSPVGVLPSMLRLPHPATAPERTSS